MNIRGVRSVRRARVNRVEPPIVRADARTAVVYAAVRATQRLVCPAIHSREPSLRSVVRPVLLACQWSADRSIRPARQSSPWQHQIRELCNECRVGTVLGFNRAHRRLRPRRDDVAVVGVMSPAEKFSMNVVCLAAPLRSEAKRFRSRRMIPR